MRLERFFPSTLLTLCFLACSLSLATAAPATPTDKAAPVETVKSNSTASPTYEPRLFDPPFGEDVRALEAAWNATGLPMSSDVRLPFARVVGLIKGNQWVDPAKLDDAIQTVMDLLPSANATNSVQPLTDALNKLETDFIAAVQAQNLPYKQTPTISPTPTVGPLPAGNSTVPIITSANLPAPTDASATPPPSANTSSGHRTANVGLGRAAIAFGAALVAFYWNDLL
ncbi:uncharacterized protein EV422DRAFT_616908 [Fimicolochytrium jonesii]|uniref:uncharacterized protein n=1 Tax=Fimicolochytrium jonesii TaxID=1396493 RepID=UPI0022FDC739|nr:uncharacterized protein EV422DRAFT_616908 [Fimicolochytrium jonesii]KAI8825870.1 hypothetical protein EV422DRAFT_616908 [Fimicolochytrium jonesii]